MPLGCARAPGLSRQGLAARGMQEGACWAGIGGAAACMQAGMLGGAYSWAAICMGYHTFWGGLGKDPRLQAGSLPWNIRLSCLGRLTAAMRRAEGNRDTYCSVCENLSVNCRWFQLS